MSPEITLIRELSSTGGGEIFKQIEFSTALNKLLLRTDQKIYTSLINTSIIEEWTDIDSSVIYTTWVSVIITLFI